MIHGRLFLSFLFLLFIQAYVVLTLEYSPQSFFLNPSVESSYQDKYLQGYLVGTDSYHYLQQAVAAENKKGSKNLVVALYRFIASSSQKMSVKDPKYFLYFVPFFLALLSVSLVFLSFYHYDKLSIILVICFTLITSASFFKNTQLGNIDHNAFYVLGLVTIFSLLTHSSGKSVQNILIRLIGVFAILYSVSTFWGSWYFLLIPVLFLLIPYVSLLSKQARIVLITLGCLMMILFIKAFFSSSYLEVVRIKVAKILALDYTSDTGRLSYTQELEGVNFLDLMLLEPLALLFVFCTIMTVFHLKNQRHLIKVLPYIVISLIFFVASLMFVRLSIFFVVSVVYCILVYLTLCKRGSIEKYLFFIGIICVLILNSFNVLSLNFQTDRLNDDQYRQFSVIKRLTEKNAVILSWWDYGYYINSISQRYAFLDPGSKSGSERLATFSNIIYENSLLSIKDVRELSCLERGIELARCKEDEIPIYLFLNEEFDIFHPVIRMFASIDVQNKIPSEIVDDVVDCEIIGKNFFCGDYHFVKNDVQLLLKNSHKSIDSMISHSGKGIFRFELNGNENRKTLILFEQVGQYRLVIVDSALESTLFFRGLFYNSLQQFSHQIVYQESINNRFTLIKLSSTDIKKP